MRLLFALLMAIFIFITPQPAQASVFSTSPIAKMQANVEVRDVHMLPETTITNAVYASADASQGRILATSADIADTSVKLGGGSSLSQHRLVNNGALLAHATLPANTAATPTSEPSSEPTLDSLLKDAEKVQTDWTALGLLAGLIALVNLLVNLTKFGPLKKWMDDNNLQWLRTVIALVLGGALGGLGAASIGGNAGKIVFGALAGVVAGLSASGGHQLFVGFASVVAPKKS